MAATLTCELLQGGVSADSAAWLLQGLQKYISARGRLSLDQALGLAICGSSHISTQLSLLFRDYYLAEAVELISLDPECSTWARCGRLAIEAKRLTPFWKAHPSFIDLTQMSGWESSLYQACCFGLPIPTTQHGIAESVKRNGTVSFNSDALKMLETILRVPSNENLVQYQGQRRKRIAQHF